MQPTEHIGRLVAAARRSKGVGQKVIATALGVGQSAYCRRETGTTPISPAELVVIAAALDVTVEEILRPAAVRPAAVRPAAVRPAGKQLLSGEEVAFLQEGVPIMQRLIQIAEKLRQSA